MNDEQKYKRPMVISIIVLIIAIIGLVYYYSTNLSLTPEQKAEKEILDYYADLEEQYKNDTFGGETPEETLELFIAALEAEDIELASKYFLPDEREEWNSNLTKIHERGLLDEMVGDLKRPKEKKPLYEGSDQVNFFIYNDNDVLATTLSVVKISSGIWKIIDL